MAQIITKIDSLNLKMDEMDKKNDNLDLKVSKVLKVSYAAVRPQASSAKTEREFHQRIMKQECRVRYNCINPNDPNTTKCMVLNDFFPTSDICLSHIIPLKNRSSLAVLGLSDDCIWDPKNGLCLWKEFEDHYDRLEVVRVIVVIIMFFVR